MTLSEFARMFDCSVPEILERLRNDKNDFWRFWWTQFASGPMGAHHASLDRSMCHFGKIMNRIDVAPFLQEIEARSDNWLLDTKRNKIGVQQYTNSIAMRRAVYRPTSGAHNVSIMMDVYESTANDVAAHYPRLMHFLNHFAESSRQGTLSRAMIVRLTSKMEVGRHWDTGFYYLCRDRYHLILQSAGSRMECGGVRCTWNVGRRGGSTAICGIRPATTAMTGASTSSSMCCRIATPPWSRSSSATPNITGRKCSSRRSACSRNSMPSACVGLDTGFRKDLPSGSTRAITRQQKAGQDDGHDAE
jgi:hypothetical protein